MYPVIIEPSILSFTLAYNDTQFTDDDEEFNYFRVFMQRLIKILEDIESKGLKIAVTKEIFQFYQASVPIIVHQQNISNKKLAVTAKMSRDLLLKKLPRLIKVVHEFGNHTHEVEFEKATIDLKNKLLKSDEYHHWKDLLGINFDNNYLDWCLKSQFNTIFPNDYFEINNVDKIVRIQVSENIDNISETEKYNFYQLVNNCEFPHEKQVIPCRGTGTHSSMWGDSIRSINDVPAFERSLLSGLISTNFIESITFLDFDTFYSVVSEPYIEIKNIEEKDSSDILECTLRGRGRKQNGQNINISVKKGKGIYFTHYFGKLITINKINLLLQQVASSRN